MMRWNLSFRQDLAIADKAWEEHRYDDFMKCIDKIDKPKLLPSYLLKYKIALKKSRHQ